MTIPFPYKLIAAIALVGYVFYSGYKKGVDAGEVMLQKAATELVQLRLDLEKEQSNIKERVVVEYKDRIIRVKEREVVYQNAVQEQLPSKFNVANGWVHVHDTAVGGSELDTEKVRDSSESPYTENQALATILSNYSACLQNAQQLVSLQSWIIQTNESIQKQNAERGLR